MLDLLERHGTVILLYSLVLLAFGVTVAVGLHAKVDPEKLFAFAAGFTGGAFAGLTVAMKVAGNGASPAPPTAGAPK